METRGAGPKYRELLRTIKAEADRATYADYYDYGYRVYIAPNWHIFGKTAHQSSAP